MRVNFGHHSSAHANINFTAVIGTTKNIEQHWWDTDTVRRVRFVCSDTVDLCVKTFSGALTMGDIGSTEKHTYPRYLTVSYSGFVCCCLFFNLKFKIIQYT